jgi:plastocyanin
MLEMSGGQVMRKRFVLLAIILVVLVMVSYVPAGSAETHVVHMNDLVFDPTEVEIDIGDTVKWVNNEAVIHQVTINGVPNGISPDMGLDQEWSYTFNTQGTYQVRCVYHSPSFATGMVMTVVVGNGTGGPTPPPQTPGFELVLVIVAVLSAVITVTYLRTKDGKNY